MTRNFILFCSPGQPLEAPNRRSECHYPIHILRGGLLLKWRASFPGSLDHGVELHYCLSLPHPLNFDPKFKQSQVFNLWRISEGDDGFGAPQIIWGAAVEVHLRAGVPGKSENKIWARRVPLEAGVPSHFFHGGRWFLCLSHKLEGVSHSPEWHTTVPK